MLNVIKWIAWKVSSGLVQFITMYTGLTLLFISMYWVGCQWSQAGKAVYWLCSIGWVSIVVSASDVRGGEGVWLYFENDRFIPIEVIQA